MALAWDDVISDLYDSFARQWFGDKRIQGKKIHHRQQLQEERVSKVVKKYMVGSRISWIFVRIFFYPSKCNISSSETDQFSKYEEVVKIILPREEKR